MGMGSGNSGKSRMAISEINVTPMVDVMLVLLIMFMVTTPLMQQGIEVELPKTSSTGVDVNDEPTVIVINSAARVTIAKNAVGMNELRPKLSAIFKNRKNKQVYIQADARVDYGIVAEVMGEVKAAGITNIGLITIPKDTAL
ncbi:MAG: biopolymer transporter ExbD [Bdellovibrionota bacterium]